MKTENGITDRLSNGIASLPDDSPPWVRELLTEARASILTLQADARTKAASIQALDEQLEREILIFETYRAVVTTALGIEAASCADDVREAILELHLTLAAEQGKPEGAPSQGWTFRDGQWLKSFRRVRRCSDGWYWCLSEMVGIYGLMRERVVAEGWESSARVAMIAADRAAGQSEQADSRPSSHILTLTPALQARVQALGYAPGETPARVLSWLIVHAEQTSKTLDEVRAALGNGADEALWPPGKTLAEAVETLARLCYASLVDDRPELTDPPDGEPITFTYRNHRGEIGERRVIPVQIRYGTGVNRPDPGWLLDAWCLNRQAMRSFTLANLNIPANVVLHCPRCHTQHIDAPEPETGWTNPVHRSHTCHACGLIFRHSDTPTNGVASATTRGRADSSPDDAMPSRRIVCDAHTVAGRPRLEGTRLYLVLFAGHTREQVEANWEPNLTDAEWEAVSAWLASPEGERAVRDEHEQSRGR